LIPPRRLDVMSLYVSALLETICWQAKVNEEFV